MFARRSPTTETTETTTETVKGPSLARGPAWTVGLVLSVFGLAAFFTAYGTPLSTAEFPDGSAGGESFIGFEVNAWTAWLTTATGVFVLVGAAQHTLARTFSLLAGLFLGAMSVIALFDSADVLGLAAANGLTALGWGIAAAILLVTALLPRVKRTREVAVTEQERVADRDRARLAERDVAAAKTRDRSTDDDRTPGHDHTPTPTPTPAPTAPQTHAEEPTRVGPASPSTVSYDGQQHPVPHSGGAPTEVRSAPLRSTYEGPAKTDAERDADAQRLEAEQADAERGRFR